MEMVLSINKLYVVLCGYFFTITEFKSRSWQMGEGKRVPGQEQDPLIRNESLLPPQAGILCAP